MSRSKKETIPICPKCNSTLSQEDVIRGYDFACIYCDEDFYKFEIKRRKKDDTKFITI